MEIPVQEIALAAREVPSEFVVPDEVQKTLQCDDADNESGLQLPLIDLGPLLDVTADEASIAKVRDEIGRVSEEWGFYQVGHLTQAAAIQKIVSTHSALSATPPFDFPKWKWSHNSFHSVLRSKRNA